MHIRKESREFNIVDKNMCSVKVPYKADPDIVLFWFSCILLVSYFFNNSSNVLTIE